jgi:LPS-assembly protein
LKVFGLFLLFILMPFLLVAGPPTNLTANNIIHDSLTGNIEASGEVTIVQGHLILKTDKLIYNAASDSIIVVGSLKIYDSIKNEVTHATYGELSTDMKDGLLNSARIIQKQKLQITAAKIQREGGRYTIMNKAVSSYCKICKESSTPLWEIRSRKVIADSVREKIVYEDAVFRLMGIPVLYTPYVSIPSSNVKRATGFLKPTYIFDDKNGLKVFTPYFITLGDHADVLLTPWINSEGIKTVVARFRQKLHFGGTTLNHASTVDKNSKYRWYFFLDQNINKMPYGFSANLKLKKVSDSTYRSEYGFGSEDRLRNSFSTFRTKKKQHIEVNLIHYETLRTTESNNTMPNSIIDAEINQRLIPNHVGGILDIKMDTRGNYRKASDNNSDGSSRDVVRLSGLATWQKDWIVGNGVVAGIASQVRSTSYRVYQDPSAKSVQDLNPYGALELKWPLINKKEQSSHLIEPIIQVVAAGNNKNSIPNEDSLLPEFDETNLFEFSRFPGVDAYEEGQRLNLALNYTYDRLGLFKAGFNVGKILRTKDIQQFSKSTGLDGKSSDWLTSSHLNIGSNFTLINRALLEDDLSILRNEMHLDWSYKSLSTVSKYIWHQSDASLGQNKNISQLYLDTGYSIDSDWNISTSMNYNFTDNEMTLSNGVDLVFYNDCTKASLSFNRKEISQTEKLNEVAFWLEFGGFGSKAESKLSYSRVCSS